MRAPLIRKRVIRTILALLLVAAAPIVYRIELDNYGVVRAGKVYRSAQMPARQPLFDA